MPDLSLGTDFKIDGEFLGGGKDRKSEILVRRVDVKRVRMIGASCS